MTALPQPGVTRLASWLLVVWLMASVSVAQAQEDHESHHGPAGPPTPGTTPAPMPAPIPRPSLAPAPDTGTKEMVETMERMMGVASKKPIMSRLLDVERLSDVDRNTLSAESARQMDDGMGLLLQAGRELEQAQTKGDPAAVERALARQREGAASWETGRAAQQALTGSAPAARAAAMRWFKAQMNLDVPPPLPTGLPWGLSWTHVLAMAALALFAAGALVLYVYRMHHALGLLARLTRRERPR